jgi:soluble lytic murein transglycosylase-like protein
VKHQKMLLKSIKDKYGWQIIITLYLLLLFPVAFYSDFNDCLVKQAELYKFRLEQTISERIINLLLAEGMETEYLNQVVHSLLRNSQKQDIPVPIFLSLMKYESLFKVQAVSSQGAAGIMQIHPATWDYYVNKMNLNVSRDSMCDPSINIEVSAAILRDLKDRYEAMGYREDVVWDYVLSAYFKGIGSVRYGLKSSHKKYANSIKSQAVEYEKDIYNSQDLKIRMAI